MVRNQVQYRDSVRRSAFSLLELMVVIGIIALLVAILLPSLQSARAHAKASACSTNLHHVGMAMANYLFSSDAVYPPSYTYPHDKDGNWSPRTQTDERPHGYLHWSNFLYDDGSVNDKAFQCPTMERGGAPRTNPGPKSEDWEAGQVNQAGVEAAAEPLDKQAPRMAYTANAAIMPRNKFLPTPGRARLNVFVRENQIKYSGSTILATEFLDDWRIIGVRNTDGIESKSHRPINPFWHVSSGYNEYGSPPINPGFLYGPSNDQEFYGLFDAKRLKEKTALMGTEERPEPQINAVGRHHPTSDRVFRKKYGGTSNFLFADSHVENMTVLDSMNQRKWGNAFLSINGENKILNMSRPTTTTSGD